MTGPGRVLFITEFRPRETQMPEDLPPLLRLLAQDLPTALRQVEGVERVSAWTTMNGTVSLHVEFESPDSVLTHAKSPNTDVLGVMALVLRRAVIVRRESLSTMPIEMLQKWQAPI
jgi:hypothetical protein